MIIPVRCFTCGKVIADKWEAFCEMSSKAQGDDDGKPPLHKNFAKDSKGKVLDQLGITKICCRRHMLGHVDIVDML